jgi:large subunit ribosomal protein L29
MKNEDLKGKQKAELQGLVLSMKKEIFNLRFQRASGELTNTARFREVRRDIARVKTALDVLAKSSKAA